MLNFLILIILLCLFKKWFLQALKYLVVNGAWYLKYLIFKKKCIHWQTENKKANGENH
jgi:hypothetical protein